MLLVLHGLAHPVEIFSSFFLNPFPPEFNHVAGGRGWGQARQPLAHHHGQRIGQRGIGPFGDVLKVAAVIFVFQHRADIACHTFHPA